MGIGDVSLACAGALVDELVRAGVGAACLSPGSRSTALALALARHPSIRLEVHLDERSSAFVALGIARATDAPVIVACTSGTAAAELLPAVVEASRSRVPLVLLTADRPPRLRGTGANQTIDQVRLYGVHATYLEPPVPSATDDVAVWRGAGRDAVEALRTTSRPVHVDCAFEEPLMPTPGAALQEPTDPERWRAADGVGPDADDVDRLPNEISERRGVVVVGGLPRGATERIDLRVFEDLGWPVIAEPVSGLRRPGVLTAGQALIADPSWTSAHTPEVVLQFGATPTTRATQAFVASADRLIVVDRTHPDPDPERRASWRIEAEPGSVAGAVRARGVAQRARDGSLGITITTTGEGVADPSAASIRDAIIPAPAGWLEAWRDADARARRALDATLDGWTQPSEIAIARDVARALADGGTLFVGNSTPIRDLDLAMEPRDGIRVLANRGASGIDGLISTAIGVASGSGRPTSALLGDLSTIHDLGALAWNARRIDLDLTLVVVNNGGGNIFSLLAHDRPPEHRRLFTTPHEIDVGAVCAAVGLPYRRVDAAAELRDALSQRTGVPSFRVIDVVVDPVADRERRDEVRAAVAAALHQPDDRR
jgi:2-succinyl-5-enolpyruvyl-6-hydroxy-3-cyclohexene-1-carboxylate synthase